MYGSFIFFTRWELNFYALLRISSIVTILLEAINSLAQVVCSAKSTCVKGVGDVDWDILLTQLSLLDGKGVKNTNWGVCIEAAGIGSIYIKDTCASKTICTGEAFYTSAYVKGAFVKGACIGSIYTRSAGAIEYLVMHLQFFWILEIRDGRLKIWVDRLMLICLKLRFICILRFVCRLISGCQLIYICRLLWK